MAIIDSYDLNDESECSRCQEQAPRADQGRRGWRNRDHLPPWILSERKSPAAKSEGSEPSKARFKSSNRDGGSPCQTTKSTPSSKDETRCGCSLIRLFSSSLWSHRNDSRSARALFCKIRKTS